MSSKFDWPTSISASEMMDLALKRSTMLYAVATRDGVGIMGGQKSSNNGLIGGGSKDPHASHNSITVYLFARAHSHASH